MGETAQPARNTFLQNSNVQNPLLVGVHNVYVVLRRFTTFWKICRGVSFLDALAWLFCWRSLTHIRSYSWKVYFQRRETSKTKSQSGLVMFYTNFTWKKKRIFQTIKLRAFIILKWNWYKNIANTLWAFFACFGWTLLNIVTMRMVYLVCFDPYLITNIY